MSTCIGQCPVTAADPRDVAIPRLMDLYGGPLYNLGLRLGGSAANAEDLIQETFLLAYRKWHQFQGRSAPKTWLFTIASRVFKRMVQRRAGEPRRIRSLEDLVPLGETLLAVVPSDQESPLSEQIRQEGRRRIESAIASLPMKYRVPLIFRDILGLSTADVALALGLKEQTVYTRVSRARLFLRQVLDSTLPHREFPPRAYERQVCLDLLRTRLEAIDRGTQFPLSCKTICERCQAFFGTLNLTREICCQIAEGQVPPESRQKVLDMLKSM
jgi:RNA polymerase sigma-70 factor, ECF subfamily